MMNAAMIISAVIVGAVPSFTLTTNELSICRYAITDDEKTKYEDMTETMLTFDGHNHYAYIGDEGIVTIIVKCQEK